MPVFRILRGSHQENGVMYVAQGHRRPGGESGRQYGGDLIETEKNLLALNPKDHNGTISPVLKFELVTP